MHGYFLTDQRRQDGQVVRRFPADRAAAGARLRSARVPLPVPHRALPDADELLVGRAGCGDDRARPHATGNPRAARRMPRRSRMRPTSRASPTQINDDLNVPRALAVAWEVLRGDLPPAIRRATLVKFDDVLGLRLARVAADARKSCLPTCRRWPRRAPLRAREQGVGRSGPAARRAGRRGLGDGRPGPGLQAEAAQGRTGSEGMKLATQNDHTRDGRLVVVSRDLVALRGGAGDRAHAAGRARPLDRRGAGTERDLRRAQRRPHAGRGTVRSGARDGAVAARLSVGRRLGLRQSRRTGAPRARRHDAAGVLDRSADVPGCVRPHARRVRGHRAAGRGVGHRFRGRDRGDHRRRAHGHRRRPMRAGTSAC